MYYTIEQMKQFHRDLELEREEGRRLQEEFLRKLRSIPKPRTEYPKELLKLAQGQLQVA